MDKKEAKLIAKFRKKDAKHGLGSSADPYRNPTPEERARAEMTKRSTEAAERNARIRMWQLIVAILAGIAVITGVAWQIFSKAS